MKAAELRDLCAEHPSSRLRLIGLKTGERRDVAEVISCPSYADHLALSPQLWLHGTSLTGRYVREDIDHYLKSGIHTPRHRLRRIDADSPVWVSPPNGAFLHGIVGHRIGRGFICLLTANVSDY